MFEITLKIGKKKYERPRFALEDLHAFVEAAFFAGAMTAMHHPSINLREAKEFSRSYTKDQFAEHDYLAARADAAEDRGEK